MRGDPLPDSAHVTRLCGLAQLNEAGHPEASAFILKHGEQYLSVNWLEHLGLPDRKAEIIEVLRVLATKRTVPAQAKLALLNVGRARRTVRQKTVDQLEIAFLHEPEDHPSDPSHSGIYHLPPHDNTAAELLAMSVEQLYPTR